MKKVFLFLVIAIFGVSFSQTNLTVYQFKNTEISEVTLIPTQNIDGSFSEYYYIQYDNKLYDGLFDNGSFKFKELNDKNIVLYKNNELITIELDNNTCGIVGISKRWGNFMLTNNKTSVNDFIENKNKPNNVQEKANCTAGGTGSTECAVNDIYSGCSVSCGSGYYACCNGSANTCSCVKEKKTTTTPSPK